MNTKFRKKPVVIEAIRWDGSSSELAKINLLAGVGTRRIFAVADNCLKIKTLEGDMLANLGDWIIKGVKGELYPCKNDIFELTYEEVKE